MFPSILRQHFVFINALADLKWAISLRPELKAYAPEDEDFKSLWDEEDFKKLTLQGFLRKNFFKTPYKALGGNSGGFLLKAGTKFKVDNYVCP